MKKGFILALLMVAMVAMVLPVSARAPIVNALPTIIIGDTSTGDVVTSGTGQAGIMRYTDALDLMSPTKINWNNPTDIYTSASYHAYLINLAPGAPVPNILPYNAAGGIDLATSTELANLLATGAVPNPSARLTSPGTSLKLSLYDQTRMGTLANPATADPATEGKLVDSYTANTTLIFVAAVEATESHLLAATDLGTSSTADSVSPIKVICQSGGKNSLAAPTTPVVLYTFEGSVEGWTFQTAAGFPAAGQVGGTGETGIGFNLASPAPAGNVTHGSWLSPATINGTSQQAGRVYRAVAKLTSNATGSDTSPGWRLTFRDLGFSHYGKTHLDSTGAEPTGEHNRVTAADTGGLEARLYWVAPYFLGDMGDGQGQATNPGQDLRPYRVTFDALGSTGDQGRLIMEELNISYILRPMDMDPVIAWGTDSGQTPFNAAAGSGGWKGATTQTGIGFADGVRSINAANFTLNISGSSGNRYVGATAQDFDIVTYPFLPVNQLRPVSNHLYRFSFDLSCASQARVPTYRLIINGWNRVPVSPPFNVQQTARKMLWMQFWAYSNWQQFGKQQYYIWPGQNVSPLVCPGAPSSNPASPTKLEVYIWSHSVAPQTDSLVSTMYPLVDVVDVGLFGAGLGTLWQDPTGDMTFKSAQWEDLGQDW
jgi:hypothetical protein